MKSIYIFGIISVRDKRLVYSAYLVKIGIGDIPSAETEGGTGGPDPPPPLKNHTNKGFLSNTGPDPLKSQVSIQCWAFIATPAKRHLNGILLAGR